MTDLRATQGAVLAAAAGAPPGLRASQAAVLVVAETPPPLRLSRAALLVPAFSTPCVTTRALVWIVRRRDGTALAFTTHDRDLMVQGLVARACDSFSPSASEAQAGGAAGTTELVGVLSETVTEADLLAGRFDDADIALWQVDWRDSGDTPRLLQAGRIGRIEHGAAGYRIEVRTLAALIGQSVGQVYAAQCRWTFGDARCGVALTTRSGTVTTSEGLQAFRDSALGDPDGTFAYGTLRWTSGANAGLEAEAKGWTLADARVVLRQPMPAPIAAGDGYTIGFGCPKTAEACAGRFANLVNFGGFPHVPGQDAMLARPAAR